MKNRNLVPLFVVRSALPNLCVIKKRIIQGQALNVTSKLEEFFKKESPA